MEEAVVYLSSECYTTPISVNLSSSVFRLKDLISVCAMYPSNIGCLWYSCLLTVHVFRRHLSKPWLENIERHWHFSWIYHWFLRRWWDYIDALPLWRTVNFSKSFGALSRSWRLSGCLQCRDFGRRYFITAFGLWESAIIFRNCEKVVSVRRRMKLFI